MNNKILVAMSGGVDSSVAAKLLLNAGCEPYGVTMRLHHEAQEYTDPESSCCTTKDIEDARSVAGKLGIPYEVCDFCDAFKDKVMERFVSDYENGATPNPCILCNRYIKFEGLFEFAKSRGMDKVATGHYVRLEEKEGRFLLRKAKDIMKDQSYVLALVTSEQLKHALFPLGELTKSEIREIAERENLVNADKPDSQDICFVPDGDYVTFIKKFTQKNYPYGDFVDKDGKILGEHKGIIKYTIGQRRGLGIAAPESLYVLNIDKENNRVILGSERDLFNTEFTTSDFNWIMFDCPDEPFKANVKVRYRAKEKPATVYPMGPGKGVRVVFDEPERAITPGQLAVIYIDDYVVGGGLICKVFQKDF